MRTLGEEIAVLDGLDNIPNFYATNDVLDASSGANYSGGSSWAEHLPLTPSNAGLADADLAAYGINAGVLPPKLNVIDPSGGANYTGGSDWSPGMPLTVSNAGLAGGRPNYDGYALDSLDRHFGSTMDAADSIYGDYGSPDSIPEFYATKDVLDASSGANYSGGSSWAEHLPLTPSNAGLAGLADADLAGFGAFLGAIPPFYATNNVLDASSGANYSGGSSWAEHLPLLPSNAGLAGLDDISDLAFGVGWGPFKRAAGKKKVRSSKVRILALRRSLNSPTLSAKGRMLKLQALARAQQILGQQRRVRGGFFRNLNRQG